MNRKAAHRPIRIDDGGRFWVPVAPDGRACTSILARRRSDAIDMLLRKPYRDVPGKAWGQLRREGWRVVRVRVIPEETP